MMPGARIQVWSEDQFLSRRDEWNALLAQSRADPLFMSWEWQSTWWHHHAQPLRAALRLLAIHADGDRLCGLLPLYVHSVSTARVLTSRRLEIIGNAWRSSDAVFSEYLDVIAARADEEFVLDHVGQWLAESDCWDEVIFPFVREDSLAGTLVQRLQSVGFMRRVDPLVSARVQLPATFEEFVVRLSPNVRRRVINHRAKRPDISFVQVSSADIETALERLEAFVQQRWGGRARNTLRQQFHTDLARLYDARGDLRLTMLVREGVCLSVMFNVRAESVEYYLQSGFDSRQAAGLSPGYLHFGYVIEAACRDRLPAFDFLGGRGLHRDYKQDFPTTPIPLACYHIVRQWPLRRIYELREWVRAYAQRRSAPNTTH